MAGRKRQQQHNHQEEDCDDSTSSNSNKLSRTDNETISTSCSFLRKGFHQYAISDTGQTEEIMVQKKLARFIVSNNMPFDVVEAPFFVDFVKEVAQCGPRYKLPTSFMLQSEFLLDVDLEVKKYVRNIEKSYAVKGCTIMVGEWKNFINTVAYSPEGFVFLKLQKIPSYQKPNIAVRDIVSSAIENIGPDHVVQIITNSDNVYNMVENVLLNKYSQICQIRCVAHEIHFLLKAIYDEVGWVKEAIDQATLIVKCMCEDSNILLLMRQYTQNRELKHPCKSKFASNYQMLKSIFSNKNKLQELVVSEKWNALKYGKRASEVTRIIQSEKFWNQVQEVLSVMDPLVKVLRLVEDDRSTSGYLYEAMENAREGIERYYNKHHTKDRKILDLFEKWRNNKILHPIHAAAALLNPAYMCRKNFKFNAEMSEGIEFMLRTLVHNEEKIKFIEEMQLYRAKISKVFNSLAHHVMRVSHPRLWWDYTGVYLPVLKKYAVRILSQTCKCSCDLKPSAFEVAQTTMTSEELSVSREDFIYTAMNAKIMESFGSLEEKRLLAMDLENCNELPDYVDPKQGWWDDDQTEVFDENSDGDVKKEADECFLDGKSIFTSQNLSSKSSSSYLENARMRWRRTFIVICILNYWPSSKRKSSGVQFCKPFFIDVGSTNKAQKRWKKILSVMRWFFIYLEAKKR